MAEPDDQSSPSWSDMSTTALPGGDVRVHGTCPACLHATSYLFRRGPLGGTRKGAGSAEVAAADAGEWATVLCRCAEQHGNAKPGCGGHGSVWVSR